MPRVALPKEIRAILAALHKAGFEGFAVGGCTRDLLRGKTPKDWDITTAATPDDIQRLFPDSHYENRFGTVMIKTGSENPTLAVVEVTTFRREAAYTDQRHPDRVEFTTRLEEDLQRRDFTINAIAVGLNEGGARRGYTIVDPFGGQKDLAAKAIRAVGDPDERFSEDALRLLRAVRFSSELGFVMEEKTMGAVARRSADIRHIAWERIRDEIEKLALGPKQEWVENAMELLRTTGLLHHVIPELEEGVGVTQSGHHIYDVWTHNIKSLGFAVAFGFDLPTRLGALFHDVGKPRTKRGDGESATFYGHEVVGATMTHEILTRLRFSNDLIRKVRKLVRWHLFYYEVGEVTPSAVRRLVRNVGKENIDDLIRVRMAERKGSGVPKARPYRLRHLEYMIAKVMQDPLDTSQLAIDGHNVMEALGIEPGPRIGLLLNALLAEVIEDPALNTKEILLKRMRELHQESDEVLRAKAKTIDTEEQRRDEELKGKFYVK